MSRSITDVYRSFGTSIVSDALDEHGIDGVITGLEPVHPSHAAVGRAHTLRLEAAPNPGTETNFPYAMLHELVADRVLVLDGGGPGLSCWGGNASQLAANAGVEGLVVDGGYRDVAEIRAGSFPVFGRAPTPKTGQKRLTVEEIGEPVTIGDVTVSPDDLLVADATGVVAVPADAVADVAETAEEILGEELLVESKIDGGATVADLERDAHEF
ncbi:RraA family protein [Salinadaptatus halalkaliphilus]|uniref:RraA family protein n=1 Tax=Salinadaptatus halalkaliphilus TaxID=2419781 RepID=A0A4S3TKP1_9EURY|nr:RraA family protein [Salinadaptatus halalkaliphilus]THE64130.1 RraA family protein [Salinadaptatus halalkaliphilus]